MEETLFTEEEKGVLIALYKHNCDERLFPVLWGGEKKQAVIALNRYGLIDVCIQYDEIYAIRLKAKGKELAEKIIHETT